MDCSEGVDDGTLPPDPTKDCFRSFPSFSVSRSESGNLEKGAGSTGSRVGMS
jgi:hypothetical protein